MFLAARVQEVPLPEEGGRGRRHVGHVVGDQEELDHRSLGIEHRLKGGD